MAQRIEILSITIPVGTLRTAPQNTNITFRQGFLDRIEIRIPPGPSGLVGVRIVHSGRVVIPYGRNDFLITDDEIVSWSLESYPTGEAWAIEGFNEGVYPHTIQFRLLYNELGRSEIVVTQRIAIASIVTSPGVQLEGAQS